MDNFFPDENYKIPVTSNYMKFGTPGDYTFRVLSSAIVGWEYFNKDNKPVRSKTPIDETPDDIKLDKDGNYRVNHFWAFIVWNYEAKRIQVLELTQKTIMAPMQALIKNPKWGNPRGYDITVTRKGTGLSDTEYAVVPNPHTKLEPEIEAALQKKGFNLENLFSGIDPFEVPKYKSATGEDYPEYQEPTI